jgi:ABC-type molybdenum transport system ATPase subunit/photorepair protein PhrA
MTVWDAVQTGFGGGFVPAREGVGKIHVDSWESSDVEKLREWRTSRCWEVLEALGPLAWDLTAANEPSTSSSSNPADNHTPNLITRDFASRLFPSLSQGEQRLVLLMRALVGRPPLVIFDEVWAGMDERMIDAVKRYFNSSSPSEAFTDDQAVVVVTHWEDEVPWTKQQGLKTFKLEKGSGTVV